MNNDDSSLPPIYRFDSRQRQNKLAKRLYKNNSMKKLNSTSTAEYSFLKNINPDSSILATNARNLSTQTSSAKNLLIPSISLKRNHHLNRNQKSLQITHGKILISKLQQPNFLHYKGDLKYQLPKTSSPKHLFKKINRYQKGSDFINQYQNEKKIIPDELLGSNSDNQGSYGSNENSFSKYDKFQTSPKSKGSRLLKGFKGQTSSIVQTNSQQTLTPQDFIQLVQQDGSITNQFCYLKKISHPYDLKIVQFQGRLSHLNLTSNTIKPSLLQQQEQYITISSRGVSYFSKQNSRFVPLDRWKKQAFYFNKLMGLQFFSKYRLYKNFAKWKKHIRKTAMKSTTDKLKNQLILGDKFLRKALLSTKDSCFIMQNDINYIKFDDCQNVQQFHKFKSSQDLLIQNQFQKRIMDIQQDIKSNLISNMSNSMRQFKQQNKISTSSQGKGIPLLIGDQKNLDMPYTKQATLRIQQQRFKKFLKLIQFMIIDSKIKMMNYSTQNTIKKIQQQNQAYQKQVIQSNYKFSFKGKQYIQCYVKLNLDQQSLSLKPTKQQLNYMLQDIVNKTIIKFCRNHRRIINDDEILQIIYDSNEKTVKQPETNILKFIIMSDDRQQKICNMLVQVMTVTYGYLEKYSNKFSNLVEMYFDNLRKLDAIDDYTAKDYQIIKKLLENWKNQLVEINLLSQQHQAAIFLLNFREFKDKAIRCVTQCLQKMKKVIPQIFASTRKNLLDSLQQSLRKIQKKPFGIQSFIEFQGNKNQIANYLQDYADRLAQINCIWIIMKSYSSGSEMTNLKNQQREILNLQTILNSLRTKLQQAQMNTKFFQTKAQQQVKDMIPKIKQYIYKLYTKIKSQKYDISSNIQQVNESIKKINEEYEQILNNIEKIKNYQKFLSMEIYDDETITKFSNYFLNYQNIWNFRKQISNYQIFFLQQPWTTINVQEAKKQVQNFFNLALKLKKKITVQSTQDQQFKVQPSDIDVLSYVFLQAKNMKPLIQTIQCLRNKSLSQKQYRQIKAYFEKLEKPQVCAIIDSQNKQATIKNIMDLNISEQLDFVRAIVFKSKKQMQINNKMVLVNRFWIQTGGNNAAGRNLAQNFQKNYWDIITEIDQKITVINGISQESQLQSQQQLRQSITQNKGMFDTLRVLLTEWERHQRYLHYFEPVFMNSYWKGTPQMKMYATAQNNWKKLLKQCKDYSFKKWASNDKAIITLRQNIALFEQLKTAVQQFLAAKRQVFPKFYFLSNQQLLHILLSQKDFRSVQKHLNKAFTCLKSLDIRQQNSFPVGVRNYTSQYLPIRFGRNNNFEIQQMFRILQQSIKQSIKSSLRLCLANFQKDQFNRKQWIKQNLLQVLLFIQKSQYTKIIEFDYLGLEVEDLSQYLVYQNSQIKQTYQYLNHNSNIATNQNSSAKQSISNQTVHSAIVQQTGLQLPKIQAIIFQQIQHRQISQLLIKNNITQKQSYQWQKQLRCYHNNDNPTTNFLTTEIDYGFEFVNLENTYPFIVLSDKETVELSMALKLKYSPIIRGKENLVKNFAKFNAKHYRNILCQKQISEKYLLNVCFATYLQGCYVQLDSAENLRAQQLSIVANFLKEVYSTLNRKDKTFSFGWKKNSVLNVNSGIIFKLSQTYTSTSTFSNKLATASRYIQLNIISLPIYLDLIMQIRKKSNSSSSNSYGSIFKKIIQIVKQIQGFQLLYFDDIKHLMRYEYLQQAGYNFSGYFSKNIIQIICQKIISPKKQQFYKKIVYEIFYEDKTIAENLMIANNESMAVVTKSINNKSDFKIYVNNLVDITQKRSICIVAGPSQSGKILVISEAYRQRICRNFQVQILNVDIINEQALFGNYINGLWKQGILINKLKQMPLFKQQWIVFQGSYNQRIQNIIKRLYNDHSYMQLSNGQIVSISPQWKFIFSLYNVDQTSLYTKNQQLQIPKDIQIIYSSKFLKESQSLQFLMEKKIKPYFDGNSIDNYKLLLNNCRSNFEKVNAQLKHIGVKTDFVRVQNVLRYFLNILQALISGIKDQIKKSKQFSKGIQKISAWVSYWCLGSGLPQVNSVKYQKAIYQNIKTDIQRSQSITNLRVSVDTPIGTYKKIKNVQVKRFNNELYLQTFDLKSKASFIQLMIKSNFPVILIGKSGAGKTRFLNDYLPNFLNSDEYAFLPIRLRKNISYDEFKDILFKKTRISIKQTKRKSFCSNTNKKLIILIDDFNLLDLQSQIGQFLSSCIKNGYYHDLVSNQKIYIHNISFVAAQNQMYEFRVDNRFLKHFKPVYIEQVELKDIADIYKHQISNQIPHGRQVFDRCVNLHGFVVSLQNGQFRNQYPINQRNTIRIMKCLKQFSKQESLAKMWSYIAKKQYTGFGVSQEVEDKIQKQIKNILNLIVQNTSQKPQPVPYLNYLLTDLKQNFSLLKSLSNTSQAFNQQQFQQYFEYVSFLLSLTEPHNLLTIGQQLPQINKSQVFQYVAKFHSMKFYYIKSVDQIKNQVTDFKNTVLYLSSENQDELMKVLSFIYNNYSTFDLRAARYFIDCPNKPFYIDLLKISPSIEAMFHLYTKKSSPSAASLNLLKTSQFQSTYLNWSYKLENQLSTKISQRQNIRIISNLYKMQKYIKHSIQKKKLLASSFIKNYLTIHKQIQSHTQQIQILAQKIKQCQLLQQSLTNKRKQLSDSLLSLRSTKIQDQQGQQQRVRNIKNMQQQLIKHQNQHKNTKTKKLQTSQLIVKAQSLLTVMKEVYKKLEGHYEQYVGIQKSIQQVQKILGNFIFLISLYYYALINKSNINNEQQTSCYLSFVQESIKQTKIDIKNSMNVILDAQIDILNHHELFIWTIQGKSINVIDQNNRFLREIKNYVPKIRFYTQINSILYDSSFPQPKIYVGKYDPRLQSIKKCTYIVHQKSNLSSYSQQNKQLALTLIENLSNKNQWVNSKKLLVRVQDKQQNKRQVIKEFIYRNLEVVQTMKQIQKYQEEINRLQGQNWQENQRIIQLFITKKQQKQNCKQQKIHVQARQKQQKSFLLDLGLLNNIKRQCNIFYSTRDRLKPLKDSLKTIQIDLQKKYLQIIKICSLIKGYINKIQDLFKYFFLSDQKFNKLIIQSLIKKKPQQRTRKKLLEVSHFASSAWNSKLTLASKRHLGGAVSHTNRNNENAFTSIASDEVKKQNMSQLNQVNSKAQKGQKPQISQIAQKPEQIQKNETTRQQAVFSKNQTIIGQNTVSKDEQALSLADIKQINIQTFKTIMIDFVLSNVFIGLNAFDALIAYNLLGCYLMQYNYGFDTEINRKIILKSWNTQKQVQTDNPNFDYCLKQIRNLIQTTEQQQIQRKMRLTDICTAFQDFFQSLKDNKGSIYQKLVALGDKLLNISYDEFLHSKYDSQIVNFRQNIILISNNYQNPYQILEQNILGRFQDSSWCYMFSDQINIQKINQISQKESVNWLIIIDNKNKDIFEQLKKRKIQKEKQKQKQKQRDKQREKDRQLSIIFLYTKEQQFVDFRKSMLQIQQSSTSFKQFLCVYAQENLMIYKTIQDMYISGLLRFSEQIPQIQQLSRVVFYDQTTRILKNLYNAKNTRNKSSDKQIPSWHYFQTKAIIQILNNLKHININSFIKFVHNICYFNSKQKQNNVIKQAKKIVSKNQYLIQKISEFFTKQVLNEDSNFEGSVFVNESTRHLLDLFQNKGPNEIINIFVPNGYRKKFKSDIVYFWNTGKQLISQNKAIGQTQIFSFNKQINQFWMLKIDKMLNQLPNFSNLQSQTGKKQKFLYKSIIRDQIKSKIILIKRIQQSLKRYKKLLQNPKILSKETQKQLGSLQKTILSVLTDNSGQVRSISKFISLLQNSICYLQKFYLSKQNNRVFKPQYFFDPVNFLKYYLYELNTHINVKDSLIQARYLSQKDKQLHNDIGQECKSLTLNTIKIKNAKFDLNKNYLQINQKNDLNKISNVHICLSNNNVISPTGTSAFGTTLSNMHKQSKQHSLNQTHGNNNSNSSNAYSLVPVNFKSKFLINLSILNKIKDNESVWKDKLELQLLADEKEG